VLGGGQGADRGMSADIEVQDLAHLVVKRRRLE